MYSDFESQLYIITSTYNNNNHSGRVINWIIPASLKKENVEFIICLSQNGQTYESIKKSKLLILHKLGLDNQDLVFNFGFYKSSEMNKFLNLKYDLIENIPVISSVKNTALYRALEVHEMGNRSIFHLKKIKQIAKDESIKGISIKDFYELGDKSHVKLLKEKYIQDISLETRDSNF